jgi:hypothetical protein
VAATETARAELMAADLSGLDLVALMVDGVNFAGHCLVVAVGIDIDGVKHPLGVVEGDTENARLVTDLLVGLRERGLCVTTPILCVLDGAEALASALKAVFDHPVIARCQLHKIRNARRHLPDKVAGVVERRMRAAYCRRSRYSLAGRSRYSRRALAAGLVDGGSWGGGSRVEDGGDLGGEAVGGGASEAAGDDHGVVAASEPDEPDAPGGPAVGVEGAVVDFDEDRSVGRATLRLGPAGWGAVDGGVVPGCWDG